MDSENTETRDLGEATKEISTLKEQTKSKELFSKKSKNSKNKEDKSLLLFQNDINNKKPKYFGKTRSLFFIGETPIFILGESRKKIFYHLKYLL